MTADTPAVHATPESHPSAPESWLTSASHVARSGVIWALLWVVSRGYVYHQWAQHARFIVNDVRYYFYWLSRDDLGWNRLVEYPVPVVWVLGLFAWPTVDSNDYLIMFALGMAGLDALFAFALHRRGSLGALAFWILFITCYGGLLWFRYDMVPALVVGLAALWITRHPRISGALVGLGAALKLWPALLIAPLVGRHSPGRERLIGFTLSGGILALLSFLAAGPARLVSPLTWQSDRGLQIESLPATWLMWQHAGDHGAQWEVKMSPYNAFEIYGPGVARWSTWSDLAMALAVASAVGMALVALSRRALPSDVMALCMVAIVATMLVGNKTFSPQYLLWLGAPVAAFIAEARGRFRRTFAGLLAVLTVVLAWLTQQVYPRRYGGIIANPIADGGDVGYLVARNLLLLALSLLALAGAWWTLLARSGRPVAAPEPESSPS